MQRDFIISDHFYDSPDAVVRHALSLRYLRSIVEFSYQGIGRLPFCALMTLIFAVVVTLAVERPIEAIRHRMLLRERAL